METTSKTILNSKNISSSTVMITDSIQNQTEVPASMSPAGVSERCFIDPQLALMVAVSSGCLIIVLLILNLVLTCKVISLKRQYQVRRSTRSNVDLVSGTGYWGTETIEGGIVGPCETNLLLEEVRADAEEEEVKNGVEEPILHHSSTTNMEVENTTSAMQTSPSRDSCIDPKELEDMPLMV